MNMNDGGRRENGRHRTDQYRSVHAQWMMPQTKDDNTIKLMATMSERDKAIQERNLALSEKKVALAERDVAMLQRDAAITERDDAIIKRNNVIAALEFARRSMNSNGERGCTDGGVQPSPPRLSDAPYDHARGMHISEALPISTRARRSKPRLRKDAEDEAVNGLKPLKKSKRGGAASDESTMLVVCSCTGKFRRCYRWANGGWQSSCCTTKMSEYPLPVRGRSRIGGRKMSGGAFAKLLSRLAAEGHDLSMPLDLKDHWARHGTNNFKTIK